MMIIKITDSGLTEKEAFALMEKIYCEAIEIELKRNHPDAYKLLTEKMGEDHE